jgi:hypothetical protein
MDQDRKDDAKWRRIVSLANGEVPSTAQIWLAEDLQIIHREGSFSEAFCARFPAALLTGWTEAWGLAARELGMETPEEATESSALLTLFLDTEGYTRLEGESVAERTIRIIQEAEQRAAATSPLVRRGE